MNLPNTSITDVHDKLTQTLEDNNATGISVSTSVYTYVNTLLWQTVPPVLLLFGTLGNVMIVVVMRGMRASQSTACLSVYFTALAVSDQCLLMTTVLWFWVDVLVTWPQSFFRYNLLCTVPKFIWYTCSLTSAWFLVAMTYQRVTSVVVPHRVGVLCTVRRGKIIIAVIVLVSIVINHHFLFTYSYWPQYKDCLPREQFAVFIDLFTWVDLSLASVLPFLVLCIGNSILVWHVIKSVHFSRKMRGNYGSQAESRDSRTSPMTTTLILTSAAFLMFTLPTCIFDAYLRTVDFEHADDENLEKIYLTESVTLFLWVAASASNFYLYLLSGSKFRQESTRYLCWCCSVAKSK